MAQDPLNMTGSWDGVFAYPRDALPVTPFVAEFSDLAGSLTGSTLEPDLYRSEAARANLVGHRAGRSVDFTKTYDRRGREYASPIDYVGQLSADGQAITGSWTMQDWSGTFEMTRQISLSVEQEQYETVEID